MKGLVLDTSVVVAWYLPEVFSESARSWQTRLLEGRIRLLVPSLHYWEFCNVLRTYVSRAELEASLATEIYDLHLEAPLEVVEKAVLEAALKYRATAYDAVFISLSEDLDLPLLTAERTTTPWVVSLGDRVESVRQNPSRVGRPHHGPDPELVQRAEPIRPGGLD